MNKITEKEIFKCKLNGKPIDIWSETLYHKQVLELLVKTGVWEKDPVQTDKFWKEYSFKICHPTRIFDNGTNITYLGVGDHHLVCL